MITRHQFHMIKDLQENDGLSASQIARELAMDRKTIKNWMGKECYEPRRSPRRGSQLDPFREIIKSKMARHGTLTATQIFQQLKAEGKYGGGYTLVKDYVRQIRPVESEAISIGKKSFEPSLGLSGLLKRNKRAVHESR